MKKGKASRTSSVVSEMLLAPGDVCIERITNFFNKIIAEKTVLEDWNASIQVLLETVLRTRGMQLNEEITEGWSYQNTWWRSLKWLFKKNPKGGRHICDAVWFHAWEMRYRCYIYSMPTAGKVSGEKEETLFCLSGSGENFWSGLQRGG